MCFPSGMPQPPDIDDLSREDLKQLVETLLSEIAALKQTVQALKDEVAHLKGEKGKPDIKPSGMDKGTGPKTAAKSKKKRRRGPVNFRGVTAEVKVLEMTAPPGSHLKGYQDYVVRDLEIRPRVIRYRRQRWVTPDGSLVTAPLPEGVTGHFGPELCRYVLTQYYQGQVTVPRLVEELTAMGLAVSKRQVLRILHADALPALRDEALAALRTGLQTAAWIGADDTGARHRAQNGYCTQVGNDDFTWFSSSGSKSRLNFLQVLRAGLTDYQINDEAVAYMHAGNLSGRVIAWLEQHPQKSFADEAAWRAHLETLGITALTVNPDPVRIATEGALWGSIKAHGFLKDAVILSDDAGQFNIGIHALCWVHAERLIHKLNTVTERQRIAQQQVRCLVWWFYADLKAWCRHPDARRKADLKRRFESIFRRRTGFASLDALLRRLHANKAELLRVLDHPQVPLHNNGSENDVRCQVTKRKISGGTRSEDGRTSRDTFLSLYKTCRKLGLSFWDYLGARLKVENPPAVPSLPELIAYRAAPATH